jgi:Flp pilus assembly protein TadB
MSRSDFLRRRRAQVQQAASRRSLSRRALGAIGRELVAFAIRAAFGNPWAWAVIFAIFVLVVWISYKQVHG